MPSLHLSPPCPITATQDVVNFSCGEATLDTWLRRRAMKNELVGLSRTYVVCAENMVVAYYSLAVGSVARAAAPGDVRRNAPDPIPAMVLGRLAVDARYQGHSIGTALLRDAVLRTVQAASIAGIRVMLVHALHEKAAHFYRSRGFVPSPVDANVLMLNLRMVRL